MIYVALEIHYSEQLRKAAPELLSSIDERIRSVAEGQFGETLNRWGGISPHLALCWIR